MRKLAIDFQHRPAPSAGGWLLLVAGLAGAGFLGHLGWQQQQQHELQAARLARLHAPGTPGAVSASQQKDEPAVVAARQQLEKAKLPWDNLFSALESADQSNIALLAVAPEPLRQQVKIYAEARNFDAMLAFQRHLQLHTGLTQVVLTDHTVVKDVAEKPVRFHLIANWGMSRVSP